MSSHRSFPAARLRRLRYKAFVRELVSEARLAPEDLILPIFVAEQKEVLGEIKTMPGVQRHDLKGALSLAKRAMQAGIPAVAVFPVLSEKNRSSNAEAAYDAGGFVARTLGELKQDLPEMGLIADVALDPFTDHGHDGLLNDAGEVDNDATLEILAQQAICYAKAGVDILAPSDMMDGRIGFIRKALDAENLSEKLLLAYTAKYNSHFYGPFREAIGSGDRLKGDKASYQMDFRCARQALEEARMDYQEGADMLMVKPALPYLDIVKSLSESFDLPVFAYQVSGEYSSLACAAEQGAIDLDKAFLEVLLSIKRAGASAIFSYYALRAAEQL